MAGIRGWCGVALGSLVVFSFGAMAQGQTSGNPEPKWGAYVDVEGKAGTRRNLGEVDLFLPITQDARTLFFASLRGRFDDQSSNEGNFGVGMRRMMQDGWNLGAYGYFDHRRSGTGNLFDQWTLGAEALGRDWDFRVNGYIPQGSRVQALSPLSSAAVSGAAVQVTTNFREERALGGYDAEAGWRVPLFDVENNNQLRLYAGGYRFADDVLNVSGPRVRAEYSMASVQGLWKGAQLLVGAEAQKDDVRGGQSFLSLRLRIPFGGNQERAQRLSAQERRMTAPIVRDVDIVSQSRVASTLAETATTASGQAITVLSSATTTGAALPGVIAGAGARTIILSGTFNTTATVDVNTQSLLAGTISVRTPSGYTANLVTSATISGTNVGTGTVVLLDGNSTLSGLTIIGTQNNGSQLNAVSMHNTAGNITVTNNTITATNSGANTATGISVPIVTNAVVRGNTVTAVAAAGQSARALTVSGSSATVTGNTLSASGGTTNYAAYLTNAAGAVTIAAGSTGNVRSSGTCSNTGGITGSISFTDSTTCP